MFTKKTNPDGNTLRRAEIRRIFARNRGAQAELARRVSPNPMTGVRVPDSTISLWVRGKVQSARIEEAARALANELLAAEQEGAA